MIIPDGLFLKGEIFRPSMASKIFAAHIIPVISLLDFVIIALEVFVVPEPRTGLRDSHFGCLIYAQDQTKLEHIHLITVGEFSEPFSQSRLETLPVSHIYLTLRNVLCLNDTLGKKLWQSDLLTI